MDQQAIPFWMVGVFMLLSFGVIVLGIIAMAERDQQRDSASSASAQDETTESDKKHPDDTAVDAFAEVMKAKLQKSREEKGRGGWQNASASRLTYYLLVHLKKGDPVDVANFCMMLHQNGQSIDAVVVNAYRFAASSDHSTRLEQSEGE